MTDTNLDGTTLLGRALQFANDLAGDNPLIENGIAAIDRRAEKLLFAKKEQEDAAHAGALQVAKEVVHDLGVDEAAKQFLTGTAFAKFLPAEMVVEPQDEPEFLECIIRAVALVLKKQLKVKLAAGELTLPENVA